MLYFNLTKSIIIFLGFFQIFLILATFKIIINHSNKEAEQPHQRIFCMILTQKKNIETKVKSVHTNWAYKCDGYVFSTAIPSEYINEKSLKVNDSIITYVNGVKILQPCGLNETSDIYDELTRKVYRSFQYVYNQYEAFDWYLKADDDTFIMMDNLREFLGNKDKDSLVSYGYRFDETYVKNGYQSGGAGYVISGGGMKLLGSTLNRNFTFCQDWGIEDLDMGQCMRDLGILPANSLDEEKKETFHFGSFESHFWSDFSTDNWKFLLPDYPIRGVSLIQTLYIIF